MAYERIEWKNREVEHPRRYTITDNGDGTVTLEPAPGNIIEPGTPIIAENMNHIEQGIEDVHSDLETHKDYIHHAGYGIASGTNAKTVTLDPAPITYKEGMTVAFKNITQNTGAVTINVNRLGAKSILKSNGNALSSGNLKAGSIYTIRYNGSNFILQGEGGEYGTAQASDVLKGKTIGTENGIITGTIPRWKFSSQNQIITTQGGSKKFPSGYYGRDYRVKAQFANLKPENIKSGVNVGGIIGNLQGVDIASLKVNTVRLNKDESIDVLYSQYDADGLIIIFQEVYGTDGVIMRIGDGDVVNLRKASKYYEYSKTDGGVHVEKVEGTIVNSIIIISFNLI